jgi:hypothetical protein
VGEREVKAMASKVKRYKGKKARNWLAVNAFQRGGAGSHGDKKKQAARKACRGRVEH